MNPADDSTAGKSKNKAKKAAKAKSKAGETQDPTQPSKFDGAGVAFRCKLFGLADVESARGDKISLEGIRKLKQEAKQNKKDFGKSKQKIVLNVSTQGIKLYDDKTAVLQHDHPIHTVSYITHDPEDKKTFAYICNSQGGTGHTLYAVKHEKLATLVTSNIYELFQLIVERRKAKQNAPNQPQDTEEAVEAADEAQDEVSTPTESQPAEDIYTLPFKAKQPGEVQPPIEQLRYSASEEKAAVAQEQFQQPQKTEEPVSNLLNWEEPPPPQKQQPSQWVDIDNFLPGNGGNQGFEPPMSGGMDSSGFFSQSAVDAISSQDSSSTSSGPFDLESPQEPQTSNPFGPATTFNNSPFGSATSPITSGDPWGGSGATSQADAFGMGTMQQDMQNMAISGGGAWNNTAQENQFGNGVSGQQNSSPFSPNTHGLSLPLAAPLTQTNDPFADMSGFGSTLPVERERTLSKSARNSPKSSPVESPQLGYRSAGHSPMISRAATNNPFMTADAFGDAGSNVSSPMTPEIPPRQDIPSLQAPASIPRPKAGAIPVLPPRVDLQQAASQLKNTSSSSPFGDLATLSDTSTSVSDPFSSNSSFPPSTTQSSSQGLFDSDPFGSGQPPAAPTSSMSSSNALFSSDDPFAAISTGSSTSPSAFESVQADPTKSQSPFGDPFVSLPSTTSSSQSGLEDIFGGGSSQNASTGAGFGNAFSTTSSQNTMGSNDIFGGGFGMSSNPTQSSLGGTMNGPSSTPFGMPGSMAAPSNNAFQTTSTSSASWGTPFSASMVSADPYGSSGAPSFNQPAMSAPSNQFGGGSWNGMSNTPFPSGMGSQPLLAQPMVPGGQPMVPGSQPLLPGTQPMVPGQKSSKEAAKAQPDGNPKDDPFASFAIDFTSYKK